MDQNVIDKLKNAVTSKLSGQSDLRRNVIKNIEKGEQKESEEEHKEETKETTGAASAGGYSAPLFSSAPNLDSTSATTNNVKTVREQTEKVETKESNSSSSSGQYNQPAVWAKSLSKKNWKGASTKWMPGAKRVQVKEKCKKFPYCNQGDINSLSLSEQKIAKKVIEKYSKKYNISEETVKNILLSELKNKK